MNIGKLIAFFLILIGNSQEVVSQEALLSIQQFLDNEETKRFDFQYGEQGVNYIKRSGYHTVSELRITYNLKGQIHKIGIGSAPLAPTDYQLEVFYQNGLMDSIACNLSSCNGYWTFDYTEEGEVLREYWKTNVNTPFLAWREESSYVDGKLDRKKITEYWSAIEDDYQIEVHEFEYFEDGKLKTIYDSEFGGHGYSKIHFDYNEDQFVTLRTEYYTGGDYTNSEYDFTPFTFDIPQKEVAHPFDVLNFLEGIQFPFSLNRIKVAMLAWEQENHILEKIEGVDALYFDHTQSTLLTYGDIVSSDKEISSNEQFIVTPNPCTDRFSVQSAAEITKLKLFDIQGRIIQKVARNEMNIDNLPNGAYFLEIISTNGVSHQRIVKH